MTVVSSCHKTAGDKLKEGGKEGSSSCCLEVEMIQKAHKMGLLTTPFAFNQHEAIKMAKVGGDNIVAHMDLTTTGSIGAKIVVSLEESVVCVKLLQKQRIALIPVSLCSAMGLCKSPKKLYACSMLINR
ncbi:unnamed protein product [Sphenostylis stenocarpa]|uniref:TIM-barrel domain-containing protein n=1 Tax=Sphenostylis stenocarpa TaxID=92480 RepID=A0AA86SD26_9FABA|nr:unnamed protein product [Sphenostylis stenocarpa]